MRTSEVRGRLRTFASVSADLLWPPRCGGCDLPGTLLCDDCRSDLPLIDQASACPKCGAPDGDHGCAECGRSASVLGPVRCAGIMEWPLSRMIRSHKDAGELRLTPVLAELAATAAGGWCCWAEAVVPVPASPAALASRGFDHGALLAAAFGACTGVPAVDALRCRPRRDQRRLSREERLRNARTSLIAATGVSVPRRVLLLDDVLTTGATVYAAERALLEAGAQEVRTVAVARACGGRP